MLTIIYLNWTFRSLINLEEAAQSKPESKPKRKEELNFKDVKELMGMNRDTYKRVNGSVRRK
ncbi:hypothetical protein [Peribacillus butanolivorans]